MASAALAQNPVSPNPPLRRVNVPPPGVVPGNTGNLEDPDILPENYILSLTVTDKGKLLTELALVIATRQFNVTHIEYALNLVGTALPQDDGSILVRYSIGEEVAFSSQTGLPVTAEAPAVGSIQYKTRSMSSAARLRVGEPVVILKDGSRVYQLSISRLAEGAKKKE